LNLTELVSYLKRNKSVLLLRIANELRQMAEN
jgi:hypothetical protein